jgi:hypothetical protein
LAPRLERGFSLAQGVEGDLEGSGHKWVGEAFARHQRLKHLWSEFRDTLHEERAINSASGSLDVVALRATVPAETFFTEQALVDTPLRTEFFKHVPGILTGIGIIGTFYGLLRDSLLQALARSFR